MPRKCGHPSCHYNVFSHGYCKHHQWCRRLDDPDYQAPTIPKESEKTRRDNEKYRARVREWKVENPICAFMGCGQPTVDCHHTKGRGIYLLDESTWMPLCRFHHDLCKSDPQFAMKMEMIFSRVTSDKYKKTDE